MTPAEVEQIIERARFDRVLDLTNKRLARLPESIGDLNNLTHLTLANNSLISLPESIGNLNNLTHLTLTNNSLASLPESIDNLINLKYLNLGSNELINLPSSIGNLTDLNELSLDCNELTYLPDSIGNLLGLEVLGVLDNQLNNLPLSIEKLTKLRYLNIENNPLIDLSMLQNLPNLETVLFVGIRLSRRYWDKFAEWKPEWLLDENNVEIRRILIEQLGYEKICNELKATNLDIWKEYTLLKIDGVETIYDDIQDEPIRREPMLLLKMTCPSTAHIHILRVPPEMESAEAAITWVNHGIHPDKFTVQT
jgi:leucine-rich repeat protein SHOC2